MDSIFDHIKITKWTTAFDKARRENMSTEERYASIQAWRRLRRTMSESELRDIARDIAGEIGLANLDDLAHSIEAALVDTDWGKRSQA